MFRQKAKKITGQQFLLGGGDCPLTDKICEHLYIVHADSQTIQLPQYLH